jgi:hypothetical protein
MFENSVLRRIFGPERDEVTGEQRKLHSEEQIKSRRMRCAGHVACMGEESTGFWCVSLKERDHLEDQGIDGRMGSEWILWRLARGV